MASLCLMRSMITPSMTWLQSKWVLLWVILLNRWCLMIIQMIHLLKLHHLIQSKQQYATKYYVLDWGLKKFMTTKFLFSFNFIFSSPIHYMAIEILIKIFESLTIEDAENFYRAFENGKNSRIQNFLWKRILQPFYTRQLENHVAGEPNSMAPKAFLRCFG